MLYKCLYVRVCICIRSIMESLFYLYSRVVKDRAFFCNCAYGISGSQKSFGSLKEFEREIKGCWGPWADSDLCGRFFLA